MQLDFNNYNQDLVKLVCATIFNDKVAHIQDLKDLAWYNGFNENEIEGIIEVLVYWQCISMGTPLSMSTNDFMILEENNYKLINQGLL